MANMHDVLKHEGWNGAEVFNKLPAVLVPLRHVHVHASDNSPLRVYPSVQPRTPIPRSRNLFVENHAERPPRRPLRIESS